MVVLLFYPASSDGSACSAIEISSETNGKNRKSYRLKVSKQLLNMHWESANFLVTLIPNDDVRNVVEKVIEK